MKPVFAKPLGALALALSLALSAQSLAAEPVFGRELMSAEELQEHRQRLLDMDTEEERQAYRRLHHERMIERARELGVELPAEGAGRGKGEGPRTIQGEREGPRPGSGGGLR